MSATGEPRTEGGFTLLEALVVVAVTALVSALAFPRIEQALQGLAFHQAAAGLVADLRQARADARRLDEPVRLQADSDGRGWSWTDGRSRRAPAGVRLGAGQGVSFYPDGSASSGQIILYDARRRLDLVADVATGTMGGA